MWPQIVLLCLFGVSLGLNIGKGKAGTSLVAAGIEFGILYAGGFWAPIGLAP